MSLGYQQIVADNTVKTLTALTIPVGCDGAQLQADTNDIRYTMDGSVPSQTLGMVLLKGDTPKEFPVTEIKVMKFTRGTASNANLNIHYFGTPVRPAGIPDGLNTMKIHFLAGFPLTEQELDLGEEDQSSNSSSSQSSVTSSSSRSSHSSSSSSKSSSSTQS